MAPAPYPRARENEIVIRNRAVAINPLDWIKQSIGDLIFSWIRYPFVLGADCAGEVVEVGDSVTRFAVGDRVLGHAVGTDRKRNSAAEGAFQHYTVVTPKPTGQTLLVWGGSTSVGSNYAAAPPPLVVGAGLEQVEAGFDLQQQGVSARKVVVSL